MRKLVSLSPLIVMLLCTSALAVTVTGTSSAMKGPRNALRVTVEVTLDGKTITGVKVIEYVDTDTIKDSAIAPVPGCIVEQQNIDVDGVTGATVTTLRAVFASGFVMQSGTRSRRPDPTRRAILAEGLQQGQQRSDGQDGSTRRRL